MDVYAENILEHYRDPRNNGELTSASITHTEKNISCGDALTVHLQIENDSITTVRWTGEGCAISQAAISILSEELEGMLLADVKTLNKKYIYDLLGVPIGPRRFKCALLCLHTLKNAIHIHGGEDAQSWLKTVEID